MAATPDGFRGQRSIVLQDDDDDSLLFEKRQEHALERWEPSPVDTAGRPERFELGYAGVYYHSRYGHSIENWAILEDWAIFERFSNSSAALAQTDRRRSRLALILQGPACQLEARKRD